MYSTTVNRRSSGYRSSRSVRRQKTHGGMSTFTKTKVILILIAVASLSMTVIVPMILLELSTRNEGTSNNPHHSIHNLFHPKAALNPLRNPTKNFEPVPTAKSVPRPTAKPIPKPSAKSSVKLSTKPTSIPPKHSILARGVAGLPMSETPALEGAKWGHIECDVDVDDVAYWNEPQGKFDQNFQSPFGGASDPGHKRRYLTFEPDQGGWNNVRMSMEIIFTLAATTGRTLVLPPKAPFYLLGTGKENARSLGSFYDVSKDAFQKEVEVISMEEFFEREIFLDRGQNFLGFLNSTEIQFLKDTEITKLCLFRDGEKNHCENLYKHLRKAGYQPQLEAGENCFVFDEDAFHGREVTDSVKERVTRFCGEKRSPVYYNKTIHEPELLHWDASKPDARKGGHRLLNHFYAFLFYTDPVVDNHYKRFVRDFLHYKDSLYCAAGKVVNAINREAEEWSTLHVRRGDLQYKEVKISGEEWYENLKDIWNEGELLFIATDERNKTFFDPIKKHHRVRFLDDYWDVAKLGELDPYFLSMVDTIVASHGRTFAGTWFSTFSGYINRMRGYLGYSIKDSWYSYLPRKDFVRNYTYPTGNYGAREFPLGWVAIDGDSVIEHEGVPVPDMTEKKEIIINKDFERQLPPAIQFSEMETDEAFSRKPVKRALAGRSEDLTPALIGASRGTIKCELNVDSLAYWNDPQGTRDVEFVSPFHHNSDHEKYITFATDRGGWNNVRMSMEIIFVIAAATGRTLVLPPKEPLYRLSADKENKQRGFADFFPLGTPEFAKKVKIISTEEFIEREGGPGGRAPIPEAMRENVMNSAKLCEKRKKSKNFCGHIKDYLNEVGHVPNVGAANGCVVFDKDLYEGSPTNGETEISIKSFCGERERFIWTSHLNDHDVIHFGADQKELRLLAHFYNMIHFTDPSVDNYFKRFVRDFLHYNDQIYCAAGKIIKALQAEGKQRNFDVDEEGGGGFSAMHIRRGDFQYKKVKLPAEQWYENTKEIWKPNEIIFIATDERNKTFFDPIAKHHDIRFLDDYFELAGLGYIDSNYFGMIDTIVSSRARSFAGTWFSTFTGYINRMRGYHGMSMKESWYSFLERKTKLHTWETIDKAAYAYEWPDGWIGIDSDVLPQKTEF